jgi:putative transposase
LDVLVQSRRNKQAVLKLMRKLLKSQGFAPTAIVTDKLPSYGAALSDLGMAARHITGGWVNNRAENSHLPIRQRERRMQQPKKKKKKTAIIARNDGMFSFLLIG